MPIDFDALREMDRRAVEASRDVLGDGGGYDRPTPCAGWTLGELLAHLTAQHRGFAAAARGRETTVPEWAPLPLGAEPVAEYAAACADVVAAFASIQDTGIPMLLPEIRDEPVPAAIAVGFHLVDYVVHSWDVAASVGAVVSFDEEVLTAALRVARQVPDGAERDREGAAFAHALDVPHGAGALDQILLLLGRSPAWSLSVG